MADVIDERINIQDEETDFDSAVSEGTLQRMAAAVNFINKRQYTEKPFTFTNELGAFDLNEMFADGAKPMAQNCQIVGYCLWIRNFAGTGDLDIDVKRLQNAGDAGVSIFSTRPKLQAAAGNNSWVQYVSEPTPFTKNPAAGYVVGALGTTQLNQGDLLVAELKDVPSEGIDAGITIFVRPR